MTDHIKIPAAVPLVRYAANGTQVRYEYSFPIFASEDLAVYIDGARQNNGFTVEGAGNTGGGAIVFDRAPKKEAVITLARRLPIERMSDFIEGGEFAAAAINTELDYITASLQQLQRDQSVFLRYHDHEAPARVMMPDRAARAGRALGFDQNGDPIAISLEGAMAQPDVIMAGVGAVTRTSQDKLRERVSVYDFGAKGDGLTDDTHAIQKALAAHDHVYVPPGTYITSGTITLRGHQTLAGAGQVSVIKANGDDFNAIEITGPYNHLSDLRIEGGHIGLKLYGRDGVCVQNSITDLCVFESTIGIQLDGHTDPNFPCYWNNFDRVLVARMKTHGFHLVQSGAGDTPNANKFHACRAYSLGVDTTGAGFYVEQGSFNNSFFDCEANVAGTAQACFLIGGGSRQTLLVNPYAESRNGVTNVLLQNGSHETSIVNLFAASDGSAIWDQSGGEYTATNAGWPFKNRLQRTTITDLTATTQRYATRYIDTAGTLTLDTSCSVYLLSSYSGAVTAVLPKAADAENCMMFLKKIDISDHVITIIEDGDGYGPDKKTYYLGAENDYVQMISNGARWFVISSNRAPGSTRFFEGSGTYDIDMAVDTYLISSWYGAMTVRLPPADAPEAVGRTITIKKTDPSANKITLVERGGNGPDNSTHELAAHYDAVTIVSNGGQWYVLGKYSS